MLNSIEPIKVLLVHRSHHFDIRLVIHVHFRLVKNCSCSVISVGKFIHGYDRLQIMKHCLVIFLVVISLSGIICPPVNPNPVEGESDEEELDTGLEYDRYLREVVMTLEEDVGFRKKLEEANVTDIKNGKIAMYLDMVTHRIREKLDEIKRREISRLKTLAREKMREMNGIEKMDQYYPHHLDVKNPHSFEMKDLEHLIKKATSDLDELDKRRREEFKEYEMQKEHEQREDLSHMTEEEKVKKEKEIEEMKKKHQEHPKIHHPGSKAQLEEVWEKSDHMDTDDFKPKTFFKLHDMDGNGFLDEEEIEALFQKELDQVYDPNLPEDDMKERYEEMSRMREHVFKEVDTDQDRMISMNEFMKYTEDDDFEKDEGWETLDQQQQFSEQEFLEYERLLKEREEMLRRQGLGGRLGHQPGMIPPPRDPNVQHMQMGMPPQGMQHQGMPPQGMQHQGMPPQGMPPQGNQHQGMPPQGMQHQGMPPQGMQHQGMPPQGMPPQGNQHQGMPPQGMQHQGMPPQGMPPQGMEHQAIPQHHQQQQGMPPQGMPPQGNQHQGMPPQGMEHQAIPQHHQQQQGMPPQGMQHQGMPPQGMPPQGMPPQGMPPQGMQHQAIPQHHPGMQQQQAQGVPGQQGVPQQVHHDQILQQQQQMAQHQQQAEVKQAENAQPIDTNQINAKPVQAGQGEGQPIVQAQGEGQPIVQAQGQPIQQAQEVPPVPAQ
ncbi:hypothetical protein ScPMuIL_015466 [Solemya velum]